jgi:DNA-binding Lrp family transcriptional regulator
VTYPSDDALAPGTYVRLTDEWADPGWFRFPKTIARDSHISHAARGLAVQLASHTSAFRFTTDELSRRTRNGEQAVRSAIRELEEAGYLTRIRMRDANGRLGVMIYQLSPTPQVRSSMRMSTEGHNGQDEIDPAIVEVTAAGVTETGGGISKKSTEGTTPELDLSLEDLSLDADASTETPEPLVDHRPKDDQLDRFEEFYAAYPRHVGRGQAERAWKTAMRAKADPQVLIDAAGAYAVYRRGQDKTFTAHPATWLNGKRWLDDLPVETKPAGYQPAPRVSRSEWERLAASVEARSEAARKGEPES